MDLNYDEKIILNAITEGDLNKPLKDVMTAVEISILNSSDVLMKGTLDVLVEKLKRCNSEQWERILSEVPFNIPYEEDEEIEE